MIPVHGAGGYEALKVIRTLYRCNMVTRNKAQAEAWVDYAVASIKNAPPPNPWAGKSEEDIIDEIMREDVTPLGGEL